MKSKVLNKVFLQNQKEGEARAGAGAGTGTVVEAAGNVEFFCAHTCENTFILYRMELLPFLLKKILELPLHSFEAK